MRPHVANQYMISQRNRICFLVAKAVVGLVIGFFVVLTLAQLQLIYLPVLTPSTITLEGLTKEYNINETLNYVVKVKGYGSNCHQFEVITNYANVHPDRVTYYNKADDCRFMPITQGQYGFEKSFSYRGDDILNRPGTYDITATFIDLMNHQRISTVRSFIVQ